MNRHLITLGATVLLALVSTPLAAQLTCADVEFGADVLEAYPHAEAACLEIVEREGELYARLEARILRSGNPAILQYLHSDGQWGVRTEASPPDGYKVWMNGQAMPFEDVPQWQTLNVYLQQGRWNVAMSDLDEPEIHLEYVAPLSIALAPEPLGDAFIPPDVVTPTPVEAPPTSAEATSAPAETTVDPVADERGTDWLPIFGLLALRVVIVAMARASTT